MSGTTPNTVEKFAALVWGDKASPRCLAYGPKPPEHCQRPRGHDGDHACEVGTTGNWTLVQWSALRSEDPA